MRVANPEFRALLSHAESACLGDLENSRANGTTSRDFALLQPPVGERYNATVNIPGLHVVLK
jgi:hypothetical protein